MVIAGFTVVRSMIGLFSSHESTRVPGAVTVDCSDGDQWRIGPATGSRDQYGPLTVSTNRSIALDLVTVEVDGEPVEVRGMGNSSETFEVFGTTYTAVATFTCPSDGEATITFSGPEGIVAGVFPSFGQVFVSILLTMLAGLLATPLLVVGIVFAVRHRRSLERRLQPT
jgi:hypothetical protein